MVEFIFLESMANQLQFENSDMNFDDNLNIVSTPAYMLAENISQARIGIDKLVKNIVDIII